MPQEGADMTLPPTSLPNGITPRLLTRKQAANYLNLSPETFDEWRRQRKAPGPIPGTRRWDKHALDRALDAMSGLQMPSSTASAYDDWKHGK